MDPGEPRTIVESKRGGTHGGAKEMKGARDISQGAGLEVLGGARDQQTMMRLEGRGITGKLGG